MLPENWNEIDQQLIQMGLIAAPSDQAVEPPLNQEERQHLAERLGQARSLSQIVIGERKQD